MMTGKSERTKLTATGELGSPSGRRGGAIVPDPPTSSSSVGLSTQEEESRRVVLPVEQTTCSGAGKSGVVPSSSPPYHISARERSVLLKKNQRLFRKALDEHFFMCNLRRGAFDDTLRGFIAAASNMVVPTHKKAYAASVAKLRVEWEDLFDEMTKGQEAVLDRQDQNDVDATSFLVTRRAQGTQVELGGSGGSGRSRGAEADAASPLPPKGSGVPWHPDQSGGVRGVADASTSPDETVCVGAHTQTDPPEEERCEVGMEYALESVPQGAPSVPQKRKRSPGLGSGGEASVDVVQGASPLPGVPQPEKKRTRKGVDERKKVLGAGGKKKPTSYVEAAKTSPPKKRSMEEEKKKERRGPGGSGSQGRTILLGRGARLFAPAPPKNFATPDGESRTVTLPPRCYRCRRFGHIRAACREPSSVDYWGRCHRCGEEGHGARWCQGRPKCLLCTRRNRESAHWAGGVACPGGKTDSLGRGNPGEVRGSVRPRKKRDGPVTVVRGGSQTTPPLPREDTSTCPPTRGKTGDGVGVGRKGEEGDDQLEAIKRQVGRMRGELTGLIDRYRAISMRQLPPA